MKNKFRNLILSFSVLIALLIVLLGLYLYAKNQVSAVNKMGTERKIRIEVPSGMSVYKVAEVLKNKKLIKNERIFYYVARYDFLKKILFPNADNFTFVLKSGIYYISDNMDVIEIQKELTSGMQEYIKISFPEGFTITKIAAILDENKICSKDDFVSICKNPATAEKYNIPAQSVEGYLFPDTYFLTSGMSAISVVDIMIKNFYEKIKEVPNLSQMNALDLFQTVILSSIVEREYRVSDEAPLIASVFKNRIRHNIGLYSCATIVYIITEIEGRPHPDRVLLSDTKIDSPYNTYKWAGLPPGPISNPGLVALNACTNTPNTDFYFFQLTDATAGRHSFTETFDEHKASHNLSTKK